MIWLTMCALYHSGIGDVESKLYETVFAALEAAALEKFSSVALSAISSGVFSFPIEVACRIIIEAITDFCQEPTLRSVTDIHFVEQKDERLAVFQAELDKLTGEHVHPSPSRKPKSAIGTSGEDLLKSRKPKHNYV